MNPELKDILFAFNITLFAGLSTGIGSLIALHTKRTNKKFLAFALGLSAGVMIYVSMIEIFQEARKLLESVYGYLGYWITTVSFFMGILIIGLIDMIVPSVDNPHEVQNTKDIRDKRVSERSQLYRMGLLSALALAIHNFPEGISTFIGALKDPTLGISIGVAIAIHNIPEGIAISVPIYFATGDKKKAFSYSFISGLSEPLGAIVGYFILMRFMNDMMFGMIFAIVAGIMVYISLDELLPSAEKYGEHHLAIYGLISGMAIMALSLLLFG